PQRSVACLFPTPHRTRNRLPRNAATRSLDITSRYSIPGKQESLVSVTPDKTPLSLPNSLAVLPTTQRQSLLPAVEDVYDMLGDRRNGGCQEPLFLDPPRCPIALERHDQLRVTQYDEVGVVRSEHDLPGLLVLDHHGGDSRSDVPVVE